LSQFFGDGRSHPRSRAARPDAEPKPRSKLESDVRAQRRNDGLYVLTKERGNAEFRTASHGASTAVG
jgi:hypothetical protein